MDLIILNIVKKKLDKEFKEKFTFAVGDVFSIKRAR